MKEKTPLETIEAIERKAEVILNTAKEEAKEIKTIASTNAEKERNEIIAKAKEEAKTIEDSTNTQLSQSLKRGREENQKEIDEIQAYAKAHEEDAIKGVISVFSNII